MAIRMSNAHLPNFIWNGRSLFWVICASFLVAKLLSAIVAQPQAELVFDIFGIAPFAVIPILFKLRCSSNSLAKNSNLLSISEQRRFAETAKKRMRIYTGIGLLNLFSGFLYIFVRLSGLPDKSSAFVLFFAVCLAGLTAVISFIDDGSYSATIQSLERRRAKRERKTALLRERAQSPDKPYGG